MNLKNTKDNTQYIYNFKESSLDLKPILGGKGASLGEMTKLGLPVPTGMTITTEACNLYYENDEELPEFLKEGVKERLAELEAESGKKFGDNKDPLLLSVRSGAVISMPGMMDTVLNLGLNDESVKGLAEVSGDKRFAYDCYRRFIQMFGEVVLKISAYKFSSELDKMKRELDKEDDLELTVEDLERLISKYKETIKLEAGIEFPQDPIEQLITAIEAVFSSWDNERAIIYRDAQDIDHELGTAVNIQRMVFGNLGSTSGTGVVFTRNPSTGENKLYGEYLFNAQGEDVVSGSRTPKTMQSLKESSPDIYEQLVEVTETLENHYQDMQDIEFTIEQGKLYLLQTRTGKRTAQAEAKMAADMANEGLITKKEALLRVKPENIEKLLHRQIDSDSELEILAKGLAASPGAASGKVVLSADEAEKLGKQGEKVVLVSLETTPEDIHGVMASQGVLTTRGGLTSHAAVVARGIGKPCVSGCDDVKIDFEEEKIEINDTIIEAGEKITINGTTGDIILGKVEMIEPKLSAESQEILQWADDFKSLEVRTNADTAKDAQKALEFGAAGVGLCRTEHMLMAPDRVDLVRELILTDKQSKQEEVLSKLEVIQTSDFKELFKALSGYPITVRLLDPPLHEFLPDIVELVEEVNELEKQGAEKELAKKKQLLKKAKKMNESNPMLGFRGSRLGIIIPELYKMQVSAIFKALFELKKEHVLPELEIMLPLVSHVNEFKVLKESLVADIEELLADYEFAIDYKMGTMIELPRACMTADEIAKEADFFSFGTNDLTQTTFGYSRDDVENEFLNYYLDQGILEKNPFVTLDDKGVGRLVKFAVDNSKKVNENLKRGICGEHGGDPDSIALCQEYGLDYVSCSPYRIPVARLAAAQAEIKSEN